MNKTIYITPEAPEWTSLNYKKLREEGIAFIQKYSGKEWTDFNHHDPGVTILEYLCFGITDSGYRCNLPITDFLYATENHRLNPVDNAFFLPEKIFPCAPLNADDYRKIILDRFDSIENVWLTPVSGQQDGLKGLYKVMLQLREDAGTSTANEKIRNEVHKLLCAHRNLCEDFESIDILSEDPVDVSATVELEHDASCEQVLAEMLLNLIHYFTPPVKMLSFENMEAEGGPLEEMFDGPEPIHGFIKTSSLKPLPVVAYLSRIRETMIATSGVKNITDLVVRINEVRQYTEEISIRENAYLGLSDAMLPKKDMPLPFRFMRNEKRIEPVTGLVTQFLNGLLAREARKYNYALNIPKPLQFSDKDLVDIGAYYSIQRFFPAAYGIGAYGYPQFFTAAQKINAFRLKGYLACMESMMADYVSNLTRLKYLFAIDTDTPGQADDPDHGPDRANPAYLRQTLNDIPDMESLWVGQPDSPEDPEKALKHEQSAMDRHHLFADHLLARFGEHIELTDKQIRSREEQLSQRQRLLQFKRRILQQFPDLSRNRGLGFNFRPDDNAPKLQERTLQWEDQSFPSWEWDNISGLKKRLCHWMNIEDYSDHGLTDFQPLSKLFGYWRSTPDAVVPPAQAVPLRPLLRYYKNSEYFEIRKSEEEEAGFSVAFTTGAETSHTLFQTRTQEDAQQQLDRLKSALAALNEQCLGFFIVEHLLLSPKSTQGRKLQLKIRVGTQELVFQSLVYDSLANMERLSDAFLMVASLETNYEVLKTEDNQYFILLKKGVQPYLVCNTLTSITQANKWREDMIELVNKTMNEAPGKINDWISFPVQDVKGKNIAADAYNHQLSIVLPNWVDRFSTEEGKRAFESMAKQHAPAHLKILFRWLPWHKMQTFEQGYKQWLVAKSTFDPEDAGAVFSMDQKAYELAQLLELQEAEKIDDGGTGDSSRINRQILDAVFQHSSYDMLFSADQLTIFEGIDKQVESWLQKTMVYNWNLLASMSTAKKYELYSSAGTEISGLQLESWIRQAAYALAGNWTELENYQAELAGGRIKIKEMADKKLQLLYAL